MRLRVIGCSPAWPNPGEAQSGYLVEEDGRRLLLDCGPGVVERLRALESGGWARVDAIVISHLHHDHWGDLVSWVWGNLAGPGKELELPELWLPPDGRERLAEFAAWLAWAEIFEQSFRLRDYELKTAFTAAGFEVTAVGVPHYTAPSNALRVVGRDRTLVYSGDSGPNQALVDLAHGADLFLCEAAIERPDLDWDPRTHMSAEEAVAAFEASGAARLLLTHRPRELAPPDGCELAREGLEIAI